MQHNTFLPVTGLYRRSNERRINNCKVLLTKLFCGLKFSQLFFYEESNILECLLLFIDVSCENIDSENSVLSNQMAA